MSSDTDNKNSEKKLQESRWHFLVSSILSLVSALAGLGLNLFSASEFLRSLAPKIADTASRVHWAIWVCVVPALYALSCYFNDRQPQSKRKFVGIFRVPLWTQLRSFGDQRAARVSYWVLATTPAVAFFISENPFKLQVLNGMIIPLSFKLAFFASWFFSVALILFAVGCPKEFRQYKPLEHAKTINLILNEVTSPRILIEAPDEIDDPELDASALLLRAATFLFYTLGLTIAVIILLRGAWFVARA